MTPKQLRDWRTRHNYTQAEVASFLDMSRKGYEKLEYGENPISRRTALALWAIGQGVSDYNGILIHKVKV